MITVLREAYFETSRTPIRDVLRHCQSKGRVEGLGHRVVPGGATALQQKRSVSVSSMMPSLFLQVPGGKPGCLGTFPSLLD